MSYTNVEFFLRCAQVAQACPELSRKECQFFAGHVFCYLDGRRDTVVAATKRALRIKARNTECDDPIAYPFSESIVRHIPASRSSLYDKAPGPVSPIFM